MFNSRRGSGITITSTTVNTKTMGFIYCVLYEQWADMNVDMEAYTTFTLNLWDHYIIVLIIRCFDDCWHVHLNNIWKTMANGSPIGMNCLVIYTNKDIACFCQQYTTYIHFRNNRDLTSLIRSTSTNFRLSCIIIHFTNTTLICTIIRCGIWCYTTNTKSYQNCKFANIRSRSMTYHTHQISTA